MKAVAGITLLPLFLFATAGHASAQDTIVVQYAAKLLCGSSNRAGVAPGRYFTAVNVHNPNRDSVLFRYNCAHETKRRTWTDHPLEGSDAPERPGTRDRVHG